MVTQDAGCGRQWYETVLKALDVLMKAEPISFLELVRFCRGEKDTINSTCLEYLKAHNFVKRDGSVDDFVKKVVLACVKGNSVVNMKLVDPIEP